jgi:hypothetical protein
MVMYGEKNEAAHTVQQRKDMVVVTALTVKNCSAQSPESRRK